MDENTPEYSGERNRKLFFHFTVFKYLTARSAGAAVITARQHRFLYDMKSDKIYESE